mmetsp:Transcript_15224/g.25766  ORF Transcript_15224/g.25766 Transcript_15224/m.25766 type:complete len:147 (+) Transcript_15224:307-747(+)
MLNSDICLAYRLDKFVNEKKPEDPQCCAWVQPKYFIDRDDTQEFCGLPFTNTREFLDENKGVCYKRQCCGGNIIECAPREDPDGSALRYVEEFLRDERAWLDTYLTAWNIATSNNQVELQRIVDEDEAEYYEEIIEKPFVCEEQVT